MMRFLAVLLLAATCLGAGCAGSTNPPVGPVSGGAGPLGGSPPVPPPCVQAEDRLIALGCPEALSPSGHRFSDVCYRAMDDGRDFHAECIATIQSCDEIERAYRGELCR